MKWEKIMEVVASFLVDAAKEVGIAVQRVKPYLRRPSCNKRSSHAGKLPWLGLCSTGGINDVR